jgi:hypothetical protein
MEMSLSSRSASLICGGLLEYTTVQSNDYNRKANHQCSESFDATIVVQPQSSGKEPLITG